ncbi:uncharacterized protein LOC132727505 isoform X2 [Ruditapes philippinarum]|uniref:uncharacterized protein LOC132727505 isoform X2 n=1 Tax=Ruditapes philippinarum TaxID=129788 RepID=UPI00295BD1EC|nr:uncharacterized protein LOC132727505 isoform X2 [Ruditapes philippinarum]
MKYTNKDDTSETISHQAPAAGRLQYASNKKDLVLYHAERNDSGDYSCSYKALGVHTVILTVTGPFTTHFPGTLQQIHIKDNKVPVKGGEVQIVCDIVHFSDADTVMVYKTDSTLTADITTAQSIASCNPTRCFGTEPRHTFSSSYSGVIITITNLYSSDDQKYWTCVMNNQQISMQLTVYYSRSDIYTSTTETSYTMSIVLGAVCFVVLIYAIGLTILYKRKTKKEGSASNSANGTYANENLGNISDATVGQHYENEATVLPSPQYTELAHYTNERTTYERLQN